jgi:hypothetical protein
MCRVTGWRRKDTITRVCDNYGTCSSIYAVYCINWNFGVMAVWYVEAGVTCTLQSPSLWRLEQACVFGVGKSNSKPVVLCRE